MQIPKESSCSVLFFITKTSLKTKQICQSQKTVFSGCLLNSPHTHLKQGYSKFLTFLPFLFQHGACVNAMDLWQFTPLHEAASKNRVEVCSLLLSHGADPTLLNCHSKSSVDMAPTPELKERLTCECGTYINRSCSVQQPLNVSWR